MGNRVISIERLIQALMMVALCLSMTACSENDEDSDEGIIYFSNEPGLYLVYVVNDPRSATFRSEYSASVMIARPDGSNPEILFRYPEHIFHVVPSPEGTHVAFVGLIPSEDAWEERHLFLYELESGTYKDVSVTGHVSRHVKTAPIFTSDGKWVLFLSRWSVDSNVYNIFKCKVETGTINGLYTDPVEDVPLELMPDESACVAVRRILNTPMGFEYITVDLETGAADVLHQFVNVTEVGPARFDAQGQYIYCDIKRAKEIEYGQVDTRSREVIAIDLAAGTESAFFEPNTVTYVYEVFTDSDGTEKILLRRQEPIEDEEILMSRIALVNTDGTGFEYLTGTDARYYLLVPPSNIAPVSPDASFMFFYRKDPVFEYEDIWVMRTDGSHPITVSNTAGSGEGSAGWIVVR